MSTGRPPSEHIELYKQHGIVPGVRVSHSVAKECGDVESFIVPPYEKWFHCMANEYAWIVNDGSPNDYCWLFNGNEWATVVSEKKPLLEGEHFYFNDRPIRKVIFDLAKELGIDVWIELATSGCDEGLIGYRDNKIHSWGLERKPGGQMVTQEQFIRRMYEHVGQQPPRTMMNNAKEFSRYYVKCKTIEERHRILNEAKRIGVEQWKDAYTYDFEKATCVGFHYLQGQAGHLTLYTSKPANSSIEVPVDRYIQLMCEYAGPALAQPPMDDIIRVGDRVKRHDEGSNCGVNEGDEGIVLFMNNTQIGLDIGDFIGDLVHYKQFYTKVSDGRRSPTTKQPNTNVKVSGPSHEKQRTIEGRVIQVPDGGRLCSIGSRHQGNVARCAIEESDCRKGAVSYSVQRAKRDHR